MRRVRETAAERVFCNWYDANVPHMRTKLNLHGRRGWPDQCCWLPGRPLLIEFKAVGEGPRRLQEYTHKRLFEDGYEIQVHTSAADAIFAVQRAICNRSAKPGRANAERVSSMPKMRKSKAA